MALFEMDSEGVLYIPMKETKAVPEFRRLVENDRGSNGDFEGRKKLLSINALYYVFLMEHKKSFLSLLDEKPRHERAMKISQLINRENVTENYWDLIRAARARYADLYMLDNADERMLFELRKGLTVSAEITEILIGKLQKQVAKLRDDKNDEVGVEKAVSYIKELINMQNNLPEALNTLETLEKKVRNQEEKKEILLAGREKYTFESPNDVDEIEE